ncbi:MAG TPA: MM0924 family protein [Methanosarcina sp.]|nr:MM0924 family protein [Methanosarcina sp.]
MQAFILENHLGEVIDVYCGGPDIFNGKVEACEGNVLTLEQGGKYTYIAIDKIIALWRA